MGGRVCTGCVGGREDLYWVCRWEGGSVLDGLVGGSVLGGSVGAKVCTGWVSGMEGLYWTGL